MIIPVWALGVLGFISTVITIVVSHFLAKSIRQGEITKSEIGDLKIKFAALEQKQEDSGESHSKEFKNFSNILLDIKNILQEHAKSLNHIDRNHAVTTEALKRMIKLEDEIITLTNKNQEMEVKLEVLISKNK